MIDVDQTIKDREQIEASRKAEITKKQNEIEEQLSRSVSERISMIEGRTSEQTREIQSQLTQENHALIEQRNAIVTEWAESTKDLKAKRSNVSRL